MNTQAQEIINEDVQKILEKESERLRPLSQAHIYMTGGTGILGKWILEFILRLNRDYSFSTRLTVLSRSPENLQKQFPHLTSDPLFNFIDKDICDLEEIPSDVTHIIHAASLTNRNEFASTPSRVGEINAIGSLRLLRASQFLPDLQKIVLCSSGLTYGTQPFDVETIDENFSGSLKTFDASSAYPESKRFMESLAASFLSESKLPISIARPFAFVGPYQPLDLPWAITDFMRDAMNGNPIKIMGDGTSVRSLMYTADFAFWMLAMAVSAAPRSVYNIGSDEGIDLLSLAKKITEYFNPIPEIITHVGGNHPPTRLVPSIEKAKNDLSLKPSFDLTTALHRTISWHKLYQTP